MAVATWQEVAVALGRPSSDFTADQQAQITWWLAGIELLIKSRLGLIADLDAETVKQVEVEAVAEKVRRSGQSESSITVSVDDGSVTRRYENRVTAADISGDMWALFGSGITSSAYTISVSSPLDIA